VSGRRKRRGRQLTLDDGHDGALLDGGGALETVGVDSTEELRLEVHRVERVGGLIVVGLDLACVAHVRKAAEKKTDTNMARSVAGPHNHNHGGALAEREYSPSGTSSRPFSAMIVLETACDYRRCLVVGGDAAGLKTVVILWIPPLVMCELWKKYKAETLVRLCSLYG
jgi:hypothetical protein